MHVFYLAGATNRQNKFLNLVGGGVHRGLARQRRVMSQNPLQNGSLSVEDHLMMVSSLTAHWKAFSNLRVVVRPISGFLPS